MAHLHMLNAIAIHEIVGWGICLLFFKDFVFILLKNEQNLGVRAFDQSKLTLFSFYSLKYAFSL